MNKLSMMQINNTKIKVNTMKLLKFLVFFGALSLAIFSVATPEADAVTWSEMACPNGGCRPDFSCPDNNGDGIIGPDDGCPAVCLNSRDYLVDVDACKDSDGTSGWRCRTKPGGVTTVCANGTSVEAYPVCAPNSADGNWDQFCTNGSPPVQNPAGDIKCRNSAGIDVDGPCTLNSGEETTISWASIGADNCEVASTGFPRTVFWDGTFGSRLTGPLTNTITYALTCEGSSGLGTIVDSVTVNVLSAQIQVSTNNVNYYDSITVAPGTPVYIKWTSTGATSCSVSPGGWSGTSGTQSRNVNDQRTYTLTCTKSGASVTDQATVYMSGADFALTCTTLSKSVIAGQSTVFDTTLGYTNGFNLPVSIAITSGLPAGATSTTTTVTPPATVGSVPVQTIATTPAGSSVLTFTATGGGKVHTCTSQLTVTGPGPQLDHIDLLPETSVIAVGGQRLYTTTAWYTNGSWVSVTSNPATLYESSDKDVAQMTGNRADGLADGNITVTAQYTEGGITVADSADLEVGDGNTGGISASLFCPAGSTQKVCSGVPSGTSVSLGWTSSGATSCSTSPVLVPPAAATSGSASTGNLSGPQSITYTLTCEGDKGAVATDTATVIVGGSGSSFVQSDKDITHINGKSLSDLGLPSPSACSGGTDSVGSITFKDGDILTFRVCIKNSGSAAASGITINDQLTNLGQPTAGFNAKYQGAPITPTYNATTGALDFTIPGSIAAGATGTLTFDAQIKKPAGSSPFTLYRFQNRAAIRSGGGDHTVTTPLYLFYAGSKVPSKEEVAP